MAETYIASGLNGRTGVAGSTGVTGPAGRSGNTGASGRQGLTGVRGATGTHPLFSRSLRLGFFHSSNFVFILTSLQTA